MRATELLTNQTAVIDSGQSPYSFAAIERICATIAHELKNPLNNILLSATVLKDMNLNEEQASFVDMTIRNTARINNLLTELVYATHIAKLEIGPADICKLIDEVLLSMDEQITNADVIVKRNYAQGKYIVNVDVAFLKKAVQQLIANAIEAMEGTSGLLELTIWSDEGEAVIELKDTGTGIAAHLQQQIFEPYFTTKHGRRGLGLNIAQAMILSHGGSFTVQSDPPRGTTFILRFRSTNPT